MTCVVDPTYIQPVEYRAKPPVPVAENTPIIDFSLLSSETVDPEAKAKLAKEVGAALRDWGFFHCINHCVSREIMDRVRENLALFFHQPLEEKLKVKRDLNNPVGYNNTDHTKNTRDWVEVYDYMLRDPVEVPASHDPEDKDIMLLRNQRPAFPPGFQDVVHEYGQYLEKLGFQILELVALDLGLPEDRFEPLFDNHASINRLNHYDPCPAPDLVLGKGWHSDISALTLLAQGVPTGLEIRGLDNEWIKAKSIPYSMTIQNGDLMEAFTNGLYRSVEHRVVVSGESEMYSSALAIVPAHHVTVEPLPELINEQHPSKYVGFNYGKFFMVRRLSNYKKLDHDNVRVHNFKKSA
ncbi:probable 2-oxoglutarate-dependent dioxygenase At5g05600 [Amborella trichopoda]|uniref:Fe2OG dioxygenase domain-containing protein n=1 Tax=Amborella trichopoda TaxID=13333 RepID=U5DBD6_AMBTC|nr:probable 2-oxoglutarate-dependent dioxygenase At5g05600 [Amborella trichopoda]ERN17718.1 hypothetical protein AMTR_s00059p00218840 [Amborella trichopoda]|eukprot:XP_006856251.1 probable 2-oxoglutarate-dependent dioxygenase At5g05600 [Amborella trichopoda]